MITVHWEAAGVPLELMPKATGRFLDLLTKALARRNGATAWIWVHENGDGKGGHCHIIIHIPADLVPLVTRLQKGWLRAITGRKYVARVIHSKPIGGKLGLEISNPILHAENLSAVIKYVLKGADQEAAEMFNRDVAGFRIERLDGGGRVIGKRCGTSQNIGRKARADVQGWQRQNTSDNVGDGALSYIKVTL
jgi:hypothetical protein